jgi:hypothetical protein
MNSEQKIEKEIRDKGLNAPRLSPKDIDAVIIDETYTILPSGKVMVRELTLKNGFTVRDEAACVSKENFDPEIGKKISRENARDKIWELEGYLLQQVEYLEKETFKKLEKALKEVSLRLRSSAFPFGFLHAQA